MIFTISEWQNQIHIFPQGFRINAFRYAEMIERLIKCRMDEIRGRRPYPF